MKESAYKLGLASISFRRHTPQEILEAVKNAGLSCIEWGSDVHAPCSDLEKVREIAALQKEYGIECSSYGTYFRLGETPLGELESYIRAAKMLGTDILRLWCGVKSGEDMTGTEKEAFLSVCREAAAVAQAHCVTLCMECHRKTFTEHPDDAVWLMQAVHSPHFRMYWQPFQWQTIDENMENAEKIAPYAEHIHVFQWRGKEKFSLQEGIAEWRAYLGAFSTPRTLLLEFMPDDLIESLNKEAKALKRITGENE